MKRNSFRRNRVAKMCLENYVLNAIGFENITNNFTQKGKNKTNNKRKMRIKTKTKKGHKTKIIINTRAVVIINLKNV